jgi:putative tryptophan/tyrosine transport system substrate-binding protein
VGPGELKNGAMEYWSTGVTESVDLKFKLQNRNLVGLVTFVLAVTLCGAVAEAQLQAKVPKIGWLTTVSDRQSSPIVHQGLRALGYVEGKNIFIEYRAAEGKLDRLPALADELVRLKVDVLVAVSTTAALAAKNATKTIPIVFTSGGDPVAVGLVDSLARPGGNLTGLSTIAAELTGKRLELLKETVHKLSRVAMLWDPPRSASSAQQWKESQLPARELGLQLHSMEVSSADKFASAFKEAIKARSTALAVTSASVNNSNQKRIADLAAKHRLPAISPWGEFVASGGLMSYGPDEAYRLTRVAYYVDRILKGAKPADIPVEQPTKFELMINLKTAKELGLTISPNVLSRAQKLIK